MSGIDHARKKAVRERMAVTGESYTAVLRALAHSESTVAELTAEVERLARELVYANPLKLFPQLFRVREQIYQQVERRQSPRHLSQLYYLAAITCYLLSDLSVNLGSPRVALEQARASWAYAEIIGHNLLRLRARGMQAGIAHLESRHQRAYDLIESASPWVTDLQTRLIFNSTKAFYATQIGNRENAMTLLQEAVDNFDPFIEINDLSTQVGGVFKRNRAKLLQDTADTYLELGDMAKVEIVATKAIRLYETGPREDRAYGSETMARISLAYARLNSSDVDGARDALLPVLNLPIQHRLDFTVVRLREFSSSLKIHSAGKTALGREMRDQIGLFSESVAVRSMSNPDWDSCAHYPMDSSAN